MPKGGAHQRQSRTQLKRQKELRIASLERYYMKKAILSEWEEAGVENAFVRGLRDRVRKLRVLLENKGAI
jgi:hypothetical protein